MDLLAREQLADLAKVQGEPCVSIYMPTFHVESELSQNPIRLKNLIRTTRHELEGQGYRTLEVDQILSPLSALVDTVSFWMDQSDGFAAFLTPNSSKFFRLPARFSELVVTGQRFHVKPLLPLLQANNRFYVLALAKNHVRLFEGSRYSIREIESKEIPKNITSVLAGEESDRSLQMHTGNLVGGRHDQVFHGHGVQTGDDDHRPHDELVRFFREVDDGVRLTLREDLAPMVLAGVEYYLPLYREASRYNHLVENQIVHGSPEFLQPKVLHEKAWEVVEPLFLESKELSLERFEYLRGNGNGLASDDIHEIVPAAVFGRIDTLFVQLESHQWGRYDREANEIEIHDDYAPGDEDLLDVAAIHTLTNGGAVYTLHYEDMPGEADLAATFRFAADLAAQEH